MSIKTKLNKLERKARSMPPAVYSGLAAEVREIEAHIRRRRREIQESEAAMTPEELAQSRAEHEELMATLVLCYSQSDCSGMKWVCSSIMKKKYPVLLSKTKREECQRLIAAGTAPARKLPHARILLKANQSTEGPGWVDEKKVADAVEVSQPSVARVRKQYFEEGLEVALNRRAPNREYHRKLDGEQEARLLALACSEPPEGQAR